MNIAEWVKGHALYSPDKVALRTQEGILTYAQFESQIETIACLLKWQLGVELGDRVAFLSHNCSEFLSTLFACARIGAIFVPLNSRLTVPEHLYILQNADAKVLVLQDAFAPLVSAVSDALPHCQLVGLDFEAENGQAWDSLLAQTKDKRANNRIADSYTPSVDLSTPLLIVYTSGTTGHPKGAVHTQSAVQWNAINNLHLNDLTSADHILTVLPLFHVGGFNVQTLPAFYCGATVTLHSSFDPVQVLESISVDQPTITHLVPSMMRAVMRSPSWDATDFTHLRALLTGTTIIPQELCDEFRAKGVEVAELYGATETCPIAIYKRPGAPPEKATSIGLPAPHCAVRVVDENGNDQPTGEAGEILVKGPNVMVGYWRNEEATQQALRDGWYYTGDVAYRDQDGYYFICDRKKNVIIKGGENIYPAEVERLLNSHPNIQESAVVGIPDAQWQEVPLAVVVPTTDSLPTAAQLRAFLADKLAEYKIPHRFIFYDNLPKNAMGKLQHFRLRDELLQDESLVTQVASPTSGIEPLPADFRQQLLQASPAERRQLLLSALQTLVASALSTIGLTGASDALRQAQEPRNEGEINPETGWLELGIGSLMMIELGHVLGNGLGISWLATIFFDYPTITALADYLASHRAILPVAERDVRVTHATEIVPVAERDVPIAPQNEANGTLPSEPIAIIGMGCRFPGGVETPEQFYTLLQEGVDAIGEMPQHRRKDGSFDELHDIIQGGFLERVDAFDPIFFGIAPREAVKMDPQQRLLLEVSWLALESANIVPETLHDSATGVFVGICGNEYQKVITNSLARKHELYDATGNEASVAAGRIAYMLGLMGPCVAIDTACSSSLVAIHQACQSLRHRECNTALAGGVNLILQPDKTLIFSDANMLSPDARCKTFDAQANGYVRGEGCGMIVLKRLSDAQADGDHIVAIIRGSMVNHDGQSSGLTAPRGTAQQAVIRQALQNAQIDPSAVSYIEAHGTGTPLGDPIEISALNAVFGERTDPLWVGSVKTQIGHLEGAAGIAGLLKVVLAMQHGILPAHLHFDTPNPYIDWATSPVQIPTKSQNWPHPVSAPERIAGISSFGFSGTNAHLIVSESPLVIPTEKITNKIEPRGGLLTISAKSEKALHAYAQQYHEFLQTDPAIELGDLCYTSHVARSHFPHRLALVADSIETLQAQLTAHTEGREAIALKQGAQYSQPLPKVAFLFTGQGAQYVGMGRELYETEPTFRLVIDRCSLIFQSLQDRSLLELIYPENEPEHNDLMESHPCGQAANFALECALADLWRSWGIKPDRVLGHSLGDFAAAYTAGVISLEDGLRLVTERGRLMEAALGSMVSVLASEEAVLPFIADFDDVTIGVINGPQSVVLSGAHANMTLVTENLQEAGFKTRQLAIPVAAHSPMLDPVLDDFEAAVRQVTLAPRQLTVVSSMTGQVVSDELTDPTYWQQHLRNTVRFADGVSTLHEHGINIFIEIGPDTTLLAMAEQVGSEKREGRSDSSPFMLPSLRKNQPARQQILTSLAELYVQGVKIDWAALDQDAARTFQRVQLPTYPFQRQRYWVKKQGGNQGRERQGTLSNPLIDTMVRLPLHKQTLFETAVNTETLPFLTDHLVYDTIVSPAACHLSMVLSAAKLAFKQVKSDAPSYQVRDVVFSQALALDNDETRTAQILFTPSQQQQGGASTGFQLLSFERALVDFDEIPTTTHATGSIGMTNRAQSNANTLHEIQARCTQTNAALRGTSVLGHEDAIALGPTFCWIDEIWSPVENATSSQTEPVEILTKLRRPDEVDSLADYVLHPGLLDACFQTAALLQRSSQEVSLPFGLESLQVDPQSNGNTEPDMWWCYAEQTAPLRWNIQLFDSAGQVVAQVHQFESLPATPSAIQTTRLRTDWLYTLEWTLAALPDLSSRPEQIPDCWLVVGAENIYSQQVLSLLQSKNELFYWADNHSEEGAEPQGAMQTLVTEIAAKHSAVAVIYLGGMAQEMDSSLVPEKAVDLCVELMYLTQALVNTELLIHLWIVTQGCQILGAEYTSSTASPSGAASGTLWGFGRTLAQEQMQLHSVCLDFDKDMAPDKFPERLYHECVTTFGRESRDTEVAYNNESRYVAHLTNYQEGGSLDHLPLQSTTPPQLSLHANATYLITGGLGALGLQAAQQLAADGARHLVLTGRRGVTTDEQQHRLDQLIEEGVKIEVFPADIANPKEVQSLLQRCIDIAPLRGIVYAAGILDDGVLTAQTRERFEQVMRPKVHGAWYLHTMTQEILRQDPDSKINLDFFVCFSSVASILGTAGQSNYAAANAFMDSLMQQRRQMGLPGLSINWAAWAEVGLAAHLRESMATKGMSMIHPKPGRQLLHHLLQTANHLKGQIGVIPILRSSPEQPQASQIAPTSLNIRERLAALPSEEHVSFVTEYLGTLVAKITHLPNTDAINPTETLTGLGFDSLMAVELRTHIRQTWGVNIEVARFMTGLSICELAEKLLAKELIAPSLPVFAHAKRALHQPERTGFVPLTPSQHQFFEWNPPEIHYYNAGGLFEVQQSLDPLLLQQTVALLYTRHDALRLRFVRTETGWRQFLEEAGAGTGASDIFTSIDLSKLPESDLHSAIETTIGQYQRRFDLLNGPLLRIVLIKTRTREPDRLLILVHHLIADAISVGLLTREVDQIYGQLRDQERVQLPLIITSFNTWAEQLMVYAQSDAIKQEYTYWLSVTQLPKHSLPMDSLNHEAVHSYLGVCDYEAEPLSIAETSLLRRTMPAIYQCSTETILLTALARTFEQWSKSQTLWIDLIRHGREEIIEGIDPSLTIGWFSDFFPICLDVGQKTRFDEVLQLITTQLREIPNHGIGYGLLSYLHKDVDMAKKIKTISGMVHLGSKCG